MLKVIFCNALIFLFIDTPFGVVIVWRFAGLKVIYP